MSSCSMPGSIAQGYDCLLVTGSEGASEGSLRDLAVASDLRLAIIPELGREIAPWSDLVTLVKLYRLMRRERPHVVHTHLAKAGFVGRIAARLAGVPVVLHTFHGHVFHGYFSPAKTRLFLLHRAARRAPEHPHHHHQPPPTGGDRQFRCHRARTDRGHPARL